MEQAGPQSQHEKIASIMDHHGIDRYGFASMTRPLSLEIYEKWLEDGFHGEMEYLRRHLAVKKEPAKLAPRLKSAIVTTMPYFPVAEENSSSFPLKAARVALYARREDYHKEIRRVLEPLVQALHEEFPGETFLFNTDSGPVLERDLAYQAGLGWFGKNSCVIHSQHGSLFFLTEILTSLDLPVAEAFHPDRCGTCTKCIEACPTDAILEGRKIDANKCISYLNIEFKGIPPAPLREKMQDWLFGCDLCQTVCPWNKKAFGAAAMNEESVGSTKDSELVTDLKWILSAPDEEILKALQHTPLLRPKIKGLKRNAIIVAANRRLYELFFIIEQYRIEPYFQELVEWALPRLQKQTFDNPQ